MGGSTYTPSTFTARTTAAAATGKSLFAHHTAVSAGKAHGIHPSLDPKYRNKDGKLIRESKDSDVHPNAKAVWVNFDGTGSMYQHPQLFANKLAKLMEKIVKDGWLTNPHLLFSQNCDIDDDYPLQIGQFEGGNQMDDVLTNMLMAGGGSGPIESHEAYSLVLYMAAYHVDLDCVKKRGQKGYLFLLGDELIHPELPPEYVKDVFDFDIPKAISREQLLEDAKKNFDIHWILPAGTMHFDDPRVVQPLKNMFGTNFHVLEVPEAVCELIAGIIAVNEGLDIDDVKDGIKDMGGTTAATAAASKALVTYVGSTGLTTTKAGSDLALVEEEPEGANRI